MRNNLGVVMALCIGIGASVGTALGRIPEYIGFAICLVVIIEFIIKRSISKEEDL
jgi:hypothetical protein